jgi:exosortase/archaeosortase family protein
MPTTIFFNNYYASIIPACIAASAYYLLLILNLTTPMSLKKRFKVIIFTFSIFLTFNILRIFLFAKIFVSSHYELFNLAHTAFWYFGSTILIVLIWFGSVTIFKIRDIPIYTDVKYLLNQIRSKK